MENRQSELDLLITKLCPNGVEFKELEDVIVSLKTGLNPRSNFRLNEDGATNYYVTIKEIGNNKIVFRPDTDKVTDKALRLINNRSNLEKGDVLFSGTGTIGRTVVVLEEPANWDIKEGVYSLKPNNSLIHSTYLMYLLQSDNVKLQYMGKAAGGTVISVPMAMLRKIKIPVPHLQIQQKIVDILDTFTQLEAELEAELEARKKQYEYYRNKLLTFKEYAKS